MQGAVSAIAAGDTLARGIEACNLLDDGRRHPG